MKTIVYGKHPVKEALKSDRKINRILISKNNSDLKEILSLAKKKSIVVELKTLEEIKQYGEKTQGVVMEAEPIKTYSVFEILNYTEKIKKPPFILICDGIKDPHNLGALFRTAYAVGASGVVIPKRRSAKIDSVVEKTSAGAINFLKIAIVANLTQTIKTLKKAGIFIYCADAKGKNLYEFDFKGAVGLVVGSEENGVCRLVRENCDGICSIPMINSLNSLNVSVAGAVLMYEILRQNLKKFN